MGKGSSPAVELRIANWQLKIWDCQFLALRDAGEIGFDDSLGGGVADEAGGVVDVEFVHDLLSMFLDGLDAQSEFGGDLLIGEALSNELEDFGFTKGQFGAGGFGLDSTGKGGAGAFAQALGNNRAKEGVALLDFTDGFGEVGGGGLFDEIGGCSRGDRLLN